MLARSFKRRDGIVSGFTPQPPLQSAVGKYTKDYANLPERYIIRKSTRVIYKSEKGEAATPPDLELTRIMHHGMDRPWSDAYHNKYTFTTNTEEYNYIVEPIREEDWMWFRGDRVEILTGPDKGKQGYINYVVQERNWVTVEGMNLKYELVQKTPTFPGICVVREVPLLVTEDIKLVDPIDLQATDVEWRYSEDGERVRTSTRTGSYIPIRNKSLETVDYNKKQNYVENKVKDTKAKDVEEVTFVPKHCTFETDIMHGMGIKEERTPKKSFWY